VLVSYEGYEMLTYDESVSLSLVDVGSEVVVESVVGEELFSGEVVVEGGSWNEMASTGFGTFPAGASCSVVEGDSR
jgi:hypothetical protein